MSFLTGSRECPTAARRSYGGEVSPFEASLNGREPLPGMDSRGDGYRRVDSLEGSVSSASSREPEHGKSLS